jgi:hypothetical protein
MRANKLVTDDYHATAKLVDRYSCGHADFHPNEPFVVQHQIQFKRAVQSGFDARFLSYLSAAYLGEISVSVRNLHGKSRKSMRKLVILSLNYSADFALFAVERSMIYPSSFWH